MPNHVHGIIVIGNDTQSTDRQHAGAASSTGAASSAPTHSKLTHASTLGRVVRAFKSISAIHANRFLSRSGRLWQRNYYDHIIRDENDLNKIREYIVQNPMRWMEDENNPMNVAPVFEE